MEPEPARGVPDDLREALAANPEARAAWERLTPIGRRDFVAWIEEAKRPETRARRIERCGEDLAKGKRRPCCYAVVPMDLYKALDASPAAKAEWSLLSADERRNVADWIQAAEDRDAHKDRIAAACARLEAGKAPLEGGRLARERRL
jgi:uncharacterized protein YdeI (YjbR/CyaY-like superfamily)